jgi:hypothetical protein
MKPISDSSTVFFEFASPIIGITIEKKLLVQKWTWTQQLKQGLQYQQVLEASNKTAERKNNRNDSNSRNASNGRNASNNRNVCKPQQEFNSMTSCTMYEQDKACSFLKLS